MDLAVAILGTAVEGKAVVKTHAVLAHQFPVEVGETKRGQLARERQVRGLKILARLKLKSLQST